MSYAKGTEVSVDKSQAEIKKILAKYKATSFAYGEQPGVSVVMFEMQGRRIKFFLPLPNPNDKEFTKPERGGWRPAPESVRQRRYDQAVRERWRSLCLAIKAKLEVVECGIGTFEEEFMAHIVLPNGKTVGQVMIPQIDISYRDGKMPPLLGYSS